MKRKEHEQEWILREKYFGEKTKAYLSDLKRLEGGEPVDYIIGHRPFLGCHIDLSYRPLIPREETEHWVSNLIGEMTNVSNSSKQEINILDIFSGSGCIGVSLLKHLQNADVDFSEIDQHLVNQIQDNISLNNLQKDRTNVFQSDVFKNLPKKKYDYIFANPPYIPLNNYSKLHTSVRDFEPEKALVAGEDGLYFIEILLNEIPKWLTDSGQAFIEFDTLQKESLELLLKESPFLQGIFRKDQFEKDRLLVISKRKAPGVAL